MTAVKRILSSVEAEGLVKSSEQGTLVGSVPDSLPPVSALNKGAVVLYLGEDGAVSNGAFYKSNGVQWTKVETAGEKKALTTLSMHTSGNTLITKASLSDGTSVSATTPDLVSNVGLHFLNSGDLSISVNGVESPSANLSIPKATSELTNDSGYITSEVSDLANYYTKSVIDGWFASMTSIKLLVVQELPSKGEEGTIYFVAREPTPEAQDSYDEYIWVDGSWEQLGVAKFQLSIIQDGSGIGINGTLLQYATASQPGLMTTAQVKELDAKATTAALNNHTGNKSNPHGVTKAQIGLGNVNNTSDLAKPISTATQNALNLKANADTLKAHTGDQANPHAVTKEQVGLGNCDNTSDRDKPISDATREALDGKLDRTPCTGTFIVDGTTTQYLVAHNFGYWPVWALYDEETGAQLYPEVKMTKTDCLFRFKAPIPAGKKYTYTIR